MNNVGSWEDFVNLVDIGYAQHERIQFMNRWSYIEELLKKLPEEYGRSILEEYDDEYIDAPPISLDEYLLPTTTTLD
jgi:hypothetical protein